MTVLFTTLKKKSELGIIGPFPSTWLSLVIKTKIVQLIAYAKENGIPKCRSCSLIQISRRRVERWELKAREKGSMADRTPGPIHANHAVIPSEKQAIIEYIGRKETVDYSLQMIALKGAELSITSNLEPDVEDRGRKVPHRRPSQYPLEVHWV